MAITIRGIKITSLSVTSTAEGEKIEADYQLVSSADKVLAKNSLTNQGYGDKFQPSPTTLKALADAVALYKADVEMTLGLETT